MEGYQKTLQVLAKSRNKAAARVMDAALRSSHEGIRTQATTEVVKTSSTRRLVDLLREYDRMDESMISVLQENSTKLAAAIRMGMFSSETILQQNCIQAAFRLKVFDLIPLLLQVLLEHGGVLKTSVPLEKILMQLVDLFLDDLEHVKDKQHRQQQELKDVATVLYRGVKNFHRTDDSLLLKVLLSLYAHLPNHENEVKDLFRNPNNPAYPAIAKLLQEENEPYIYRFVGDSLESTNAPGMVIAAISKRLDIGFLNAILDRITEVPDENIRNNLSRIHKFEWTANVRPIVVQLDEEHQVLLVELVKHSSIPDEDALNILRTIVLYGRPRGRSAAVSELSTHPGSEGDQLIMQASEDDDPDVQAAAAKLLRTRDNPEGMVRLIHLADSPYESVRDAVRDALPEFRIDRFLAGFDQMSEEQRKVSLKLVRKLDKRTNEYLKRELLYGAPDKKARAIRCIELGEIVPLFEETLSAVLLESDLVPLRVKAAQILACGQREVSRNSLLQSMHKDTSLDVRLTAKASLEARTRDS